MNKNTKTLFYSLSTTIFFFDKVTVEILKHVTQAGETDKYKIEERLTLHSTFAG